MVCRVAVRVLHIPTRRWSSPAVLDGLPTRVAALGGSRISKPTGLSREKSRLWARMSRQSPWWSVIPSA
jgi:hypothetical protein